MQKLSLIVLLFVLAAPPAHAQFLVGSVVSGVQAAQEEAFEAFMKIQLVQQLEVLRQNYQASVNYYQQFKQLNSGKGILANLSQQLKSAEDSQLQQESQELLHSYTGPTATDNFFQTVDQTIYDNLKYAGAEAANAISDKQTGVSIAQSASGLSPKDADNLSAKSQGLELQMLAQIHQDDLRLIQLSSLRLSGQNQNDEGQATMIQDINQSIKAHYPGVTTGQTTPAPEAQ